jgi:hypothetical protein
MKNVVLDENMIVSKFSPAIQFYQCEVQNELSSKTHTNIPLRGKKDALQTKETKLKLEEAFTPINLLGKHSCSQVFTAEPS